MDTATLTTLANSNELIVRILGGSTVLTAVTSIWTSANSWGTGTVPTTAGRSCNNTTAGALPLPGTTPANGTTYFFARGRHEGTTQNNHFVFVDRMVDYGGFVANLNTAQAVGAMALPARAGTGAGVMAYIEVFTTSTSSSATSATISYTNQAGIAGRTGTLTLAAAWAAATRVYQFALQAGDTGVQSIQTFTLGTASTNAGSIGLVLGRPVFNIGCVANAAANINLSAPYKDILTTGSGPVTTTSCLWPFVMTSSTTLAAFSIFYSLV